MPVYDFAGNLSSLDKVPTNRQPKTWTQLQSGFDPPAPKAAADGPVPFDFSTDGWDGWRTNNWALQYDTLPWLRDSIQFARKMQPAQQDAIMSLVRALQNREGTSAAFRQQQSGQAREQGRRLGMALAAQGGTGTQALRRGAMLDSMNRGADASSSFDAYLQSPKGQQEALQQIIQAISMASTAEALNAYQGISNVAFGAEGIKLQNDQLSKQGGGGLGGIIGGILGTMTGGGAGGLGSILGALGGMGGDPLQKEQRVLCLLGRQ